jgi:hypothetical protein
LTNTELSGIKEELTDQNEIFSSFKGQLNSTITQLNISMYEVGSFINECNQMQMEIIKEAKESNVSLLNDKIGEIMEVINVIRVSDNFGNIQEMIRHLSDRVSSHKGNVENLIDAIMNGIAEIKKQNGNENEILYHNLCCVLEILKGIMTGIIDQNKQIGMITQIMNK